MEGEINMIRNFYISPVMRHYKIRESKISKKIITFSGLYNSLRSVDNFRLLEKAIIKENPDAIFMNGNIMKSSLWLDFNSYVYFGQFLKAISQNAEVFLTLGHYDLKGLFCTDVIEKFHQLKNFNPNKIVPVFNEIVITPNFEVGAVCSKVSTFANSDYARKCFLSSSSNLKLSRDSKRMRVILLERPEFGIGAQKDFITRSDLILTRSLGMTNPNKVTSNLESCLDKSLVFKPFERLGKFKFKFNPFLLKKVEQARGIIFINDSGVPRFLELDLGYLYENVSSYNNQSIWEPTLAASAYNHIADENLHPVLITEDYSRQHFDTGNVSVLKLMK